jgi:hypothetical protein
LDQVTKLCFMSINVGYIIDIWKKNNIHGYNIVCNLFNNLYRHFSKKIGIIHKYEFNHITFDSLSTIPRPIWMWPLWRGIEYTIRGKVVVSLKFELW